MGQKSQRNKNVVSRGVGSWYYAVGSLLTPSGLTATDKIKPGGEKGLRAST